jgi:hypothetical protein
MVPVRDVDPHLSVTPVCLESFPASERDPSGASSCTCEKKVDTKRERCLTHVYEKLSQASFKFSAVS